MPARDPATRSPAARITAAVTPLLLRQTRARLYGRLTAGIEGLDDATYPVLSGLDRTGPTTASRLGEQIGLDRTVTTRHATRLEHAGLIARTPDPGDARATVLTLTPRGRDAVAEMRGRLEQVVAEALGSWDEAETETFVHRLQQLVDALLRSDTHQPTD